MWQKIKQICSDSSKCGGTIFQEVLNHHTGISSIDSILGTYIGSMRLDKTGENMESDIRIYLSCLLKSVLDFFLHISYKIKSSFQKEPTTKQVQVKIDITSVYRIAGSSLLRMIKKWQTVKFLRRLTKSRRVESYWLSRNQS